MNANKSINHQLITKECIEILKRSEPYKMSGRYPCFTGYMVRYSPSTYLPSRKPL